MFSQYPSHWKLCNLQELCNNAGFIATGLSRSISSDTTLPVIRPESIVDDKINFKRFPKQLPVSEFKASRFSVRRGDIICNRRGNIHGKLFIDSPLEGWLCGSGCFHIRTGRELCGKYLFYYLSHPNVKAWIEHRASGLLMPHVSIDVYRELPVLRPPMEEQAEIANILGVLEEKVRVCEEVVRALEMCAQDLIRSILKIPPESRAPAELDSYRSEDGLEVRSVKEICTRISNGRTPPKNRIEYWKPDEIRWLNSNELNSPITLSAENSISLLGARDNKIRLWPKGSLIVSLFGNSIGNVTYLGIEACGNQACCALELPPDRNIYVYFYLRLMDSFKTLLKTNNADHLNQTMVANAKIVLPMGEVLKNINSQIIPLFNRIMHSMSEIVQIKSMLREFLPRLVTGNILASQLSAV